jgi:hypothetical protein
VTDPHLLEVDSDVLREFGFIQSGNGWSKLTLNAVGSLSSITSFIGGLLLDSSFESVTGVAKATISAVAEHGKPEAAVALERHLWPAKITGMDVPTFIVPIRPEWAQHFFDTELGSQLLFGLRDDLHLGLEGVYYRSAKNNNLVAPGRVLWYVSQGDGIGSMTIKACSHLEEVAVGKPKALFRKFQRLGVYQWRDIYLLAGNDLMNDVVAFRFRMTERFKEGVDLQFCERHDIRGPFMSPRQISEEQFAIIYKKGMLL